jgi:Domain of unknown function (DUF222)
MTGVTVPADAVQAMDMVRAGLKYLAAVDATQLAAQVQAECLKGLEQATAIGTVARTSILAAFNAGQGYLDDGAYGLTSWLLHQVRISKGAAAGHTAWMRRGRGHPRMLEAMTNDVLSESWARILCGWTGKLPEEARDAADEILVAAARAGLDLNDLTALAAEMLARAQPEPGDDDPEKTFEDRGVRLETTFAGAGVLTGDVTPECAAALATVLDALSAPRGAADERSHEQRYHDALEEAMRRLVAAGLLPKRAGQAAKVIAHISLADLRDLDTDSALQKQWAARVHAAWAAHRAAASVTGSDSGAWLEGDAARGFACDAGVTPIVTGEVNPAVIEDLVRLCVQLAGYGPAEAGTEDALDSPGRDALELAIIGRAVALVSGPGGLASFLRRRELGGRLGGPSLPLDVGVSRDVPTAIRTAIILRDQHCRFPGGCDQPAAACEVHHTTPQAHAGKTSIEDCGLFCWFHHHVAIHELGWTVTLNPDGTTTAISPDGTKTLHSHGPPTARAG